MTTTATGQRGLAKANLKQLLAECVSLQNAVIAPGIAIDEIDPLAPPFSLLSEEEKIAAAKLHIHITAVLAADEETEFDRPLLLVMAVESDVSTEIATQTHSYSGDIEVRFEKDIPEALLGDGNLADAFTDFENFYEAVIAEAQNLSQQPGYFAINSIEIIEGPVFLKSARSDKDVIGVRLKVNWGFE